MLNTNTYEIPFETYYQSETYDQSDVFAVTGKSMMVVLDTLVLRLYTIPENMCNIGVG